MTILIILWLYFDNLFIFHFKYSIVVHKVWNKKNCSHFLFFSNAEGNSYRINSIVVWSCEMIPFLCLSCHCGCCYLALHDFYDSLCWLRAARSNSWWQHRTGSIWWHVFPAVKTWHFSPGQTNCFCRICQNRTTWGKKRENSYTKAGLGSFMY